MAAFDRVASGIPEMDGCFDNIRLGDNVVWRVDRLEDFRLFVEPYVEQAIRDKRRLIYIRFASHEPLFREQEGLKIVPVEGSSAPYMTSSRTLGSSGYRRSKVCG